MVHFERGCPYSSQGKSTLPSPLLVAALLKIVSHANIFFLWHYHSTLQEMAAYIILNHISFLMLANHSSVPFSETISHQIILSIIPSKKLIIACILSVVCGVHRIVSYGTIIFCSYLQQFDNQYPCQELNLTFT